MKKHTLTVLIVGAVALACGLAGTIVLRWKHHTAASARASAQLAQQIQQLHRQAQARNQHCYQTYCAAVQNIIASRAQRAKQGIPGAVGEVATFKGSAKLCYLMALDKLKGTTRTSEHIGTILNKHMLGEIGAVAKDLEIAYARLHDQLARNTADFEVQLAALRHQMADKRTPPPPFPSNAQTLQQVSDRMMQAAVCKMLGTTGLALEALFIRSTVASAQRVLGHIARRMGTAAALSLGSAAADGPLPIGDVIGLVLATGGSLWCARDLYKAHETFSKELPPLLDNAVNEIANQLRSVAVEQGQKLYAAYDAANANTCATVLNQLHTRRNI